jgi:hypothetical protein
MKTVPLHGAKAAGRAVLVDDEDYELVSQYKWYVQEDARKGRSRGPYAITVLKSGTPRQVTFRMHKLLTGWPETDHRDGNGLNNQRSNLRPTRDGQNQRNQRKTTNPCSSRYKGVSYDRGHAKWHAYIMLNRKRSHLGYFTEEADAARAYDTAALSAFGEYARLNLPQENQENHGDDLP